MLPLEDAVKHPILKHCFYFKYTNYFKTSLILKNWDLKPKSTFKSSYNKIDWLIELVTNIRSTKVNLNVSPGSFIDISIND